MLLDPEVFEEELKAHMKYPNFRGIRWRVSGGTLTLLALLTGAASLRLYALACSNSSLWATGSTIPSTTTQRVLTTPTSALTGRRWRSTAWCSTFGTG